MDKIVSIIIPTYNGEKYINATILSCLNQNYDKLEIIVIDDCSYDNTINILKEFNDKIQLIINKENQGFVKNVNKGVKISKGEYFILLGHDDILLESHIKEMVSEFENDIVAVHCNSIIIDDKGKSIKVSKNDFKQIKKTKNPMYELSLNNFIQSCGMMHKKSIFDKVGCWDEKYKNFGEWLYYVKMLQYGNLKYSTRVKAFYRKHDTNITKTFKDIEVSIELEKYKNQCRYLAHKLNSNSLSENINYYIKRLKLNIKYKKK